MRSSAREVEDVPELMQQIQSLLPVKEAARTSVLSKSWLHAWSTIPTLRFNVGIGKGMKLVDMDRILTSYLHDKIPIERFKLVIVMENQESASHVEKWIGSVATKTNLKEFSISTMLNGTSFTLPNDILTNENLTTIRVSAPSGTPVRMPTIPHLMINCVSLQELHLNSVSITEEALHDILSSCTFLMKITLKDSCNGFKTIKFKNLPRLYELQLSLSAFYSTTLEISDVPNLHVFSYKLDARYHAPIPFNAYTISLGRSITQLVLGGVITDNACLDMIKSEFPLLESLTLYMTSWILGSFHFTSTSIKRFSLLLCRYMLIDIQVYAPKLIFFEFSGDILPSLLFPDSSLKQLKLSLGLHDPVDASFFLKMRELLMLSRYCYLDLYTDNSNPPLDIDIDDLKTRLVFPPARNVEVLSFETRHDEILWERSPFFDAFFEICYPKRVFAEPDLDFRHNNHFCRFMLREVLEKKENTNTMYWPYYLKQVQIRLDPPGKWKILTNSHRKFLDGSVPDVYLEFKLKWN